MPELPETETIARDLHEDVRGATITHVEITRPDVLRDLAESAWPHTLRELVIARVWRRAKLVVLDLASAVDAADVTQHLVVQPRFTGALLVDDGSLPASLREFVCVTFALRDGRQLHYRDVRRLGTVACQTPARFAEYTRVLGPEPLAPTMRGEQLAATLGRSTRPLKALLMDQTRLAGVGNIYATEACWAAALDPSRSGTSLTHDEWQRLHEALVRILTASIAARGTSFRDYRDARGAQGQYVHALQAYGRAGAPCPRCARRLIGTEAIDGRMTVLCAWCQQ